MKKRLSVLFVLLLVTLGIQKSLAEVITPEVAKITADNFISLDESWRGCDDAQITLVECAGVPAYYVVEYNKGGWVLISAQSSSTPIIGYNTTDFYAVPEPMQAVLNANAQRIVDNARLYAELEHKGWANARQRKPAADPLTVPDIEPLIKVDLNQTYPYNKYCPQVGGETCMVGCVAVAMAQAMMVQCYPERPVGKYTYSDPGSGTHTIDYDAEKPYDWDAMLRSDETDNYDEVARLLYHCGVSVNMEYGVEGSGTPETPVPKALVRNFCYDEEFIEMVYKPQDGNGWLELMLDDLFLGRVVIYFGGGDMGGHCWNLDGWKQSTQKVHVNWGWGGYGNGYFDIEAMRDQYQGMEFPEYNLAILGVGTPTTAPYGIKLSTTSFAKGTPAGTALADVVVACEDAEAQLSFETFGPNNVAGKPTTSPYVVEDGKLKTTQEVADSNKFKYLKIKVTNTATGEFFEKEFSINITSGVSSVMSDAVRVYPSVVESSLTIEAPIAGGDYTIYSVSGVQVAAGQMTGYEMQIDLSSLSAGTYILRYTHNQGVGVKTFIKK